MAEQRRYWVNSDGDITFQEPDGSQWFARIRNQWGEFRSEPRDTNDLGTPIPAGYRPVPTREEATEVRPGLYAAMSCITGTWVEKTDGVGGFAEPEFYIWLESAPEEDGNRLAEPRSPTQLTRKEQAEWLAQQGGGECADVAVGAAISPAPGLATCEHCERPIATHEGAGLATLDLHRACLDGYSRSRRPVPKPTPPDWDMMKADSAGQRDHRVTSAIGHVSGRATTAEAVNGALSRQRREMLRDAREAAEDVWQRVGVLMGGPKRGR